ncbi:MAG: flagellar basal body-associated FliL family protein [Henriciella sp.]
MIDKLIPMVIVVVGAAGGTFGGQMLKSPAPSQAAVEHEDKADHKSDDDYGEKKSSYDKADKADKGHSSDKGKKSGYGSGDAAYHNFSREFVVPVMQGDRVKSLVILNISLEADESISSKLFSQEPKLRDNIMTTLIQLSSGTDVFENLTDAESYETIRTMVLKNLDSVISTGIHNVLILDVGKQDV